MLTPRPRQRGGAMLVTLVVTAVLLAGAAMLVSLQVNSTRATGLTRAKITASNCSEAGLAAARNVVAANYGLWNPNLCSPTDTQPCPEPAFLAHPLVDHDLDGDGTTADFQVLLKDNDDELPPLTNNLDQDNDLKVYIVVTCLLFPNEAPKEVKELVEYNGGGTCYNAQLGGCGGNNNAN